MFTEAETAVSALVLQRPAGRLSPGILLKVRLPPEWSAIWDPGVEALPWRPKQHELFLHLGASPEL